MKKRIIKYIFIAVLIVVAVLLFSAITFFGLNAYHFSKDGIAASLKREMKSPGSNHSYIMNDPVRALTQYKAIALDPNFECPVRALALKRYYFFAKHLNNNKDILFLARRISFEKGLCHRVRFEVLNLYFKSCHLQMPLDKEDGDALCRVLTTGNLTLLRFGFFLLPRLRLPPPSRLKIRRQVMAGVSAELAKTNLSSATGRRKKKALLELKKKIEKFSTVRLHD